jgi:hypothetical protein
MWVRLLSVARLKEYASSTNVGIAPEKITAYTVANSNRATRYLVELGEPSCATLGGRRTDSVAGEIMVAWCF